MLDIPFLLDKCQDCGSKWRAGDRDASSRCLVCGSANVARGRPAVLVGAGLAVLAAAAIAFAATRSHGHADAPANGTAAGSSPSYVAPIATSRPGEPAAAQTAPAVPATKLTGKGDAPAPGEKGAGDVPEPAATAAEEFPSVDCAVSRSEVAHKVCASPTLTKMDQDLALVYSYAAQGDNQKQTMSLDQEHWQRNVLAACADEACMIAAYKERTEQLAGGLSGQ